MNQQLPLAVELHPQLGLDNFIPGKNAQLLTLLTRIAAEKTDELVFISGAADSGKTHLLMGLCQQAQLAGRSCAYLPLDELSQLSPDMLQGMENMDIIALDGVQHICGNPAWEEALFVLFNLTRDREHSMVCCANLAPSNLPLALPDLRSRFTWGSIYVLHSLDDEHLMQLLQIQADKRGLQLKSKVAQWLLTHHSRNPRHLLQLLERLDLAALADKRHNLTLPFVQSRL
jgi:DnaA family protein